VQKTGPKKSYASVPLREFLASTAPKEFLFYSNGYNKMLKSSFKTYFVE
jgi:hypothetical protein